MTEAAPHAREARAQTAGGAQEGSPGHPPALAARGIGKRFGDKVANDGVDFTAERGQVRALLGENGAGKTTLISVLCGQYQPDEGRIEVDGRQVRFRAPKDALDAGVGVVHQDFRLVQRFDVMENVILGLRESAGRDAQSKIAETAADIGFQLDPRAHVGALGVGEQQQVEILKLLYRGSEVLILDEPTAVLAPQQADQLFTALRRLADKGKAIVFITHRLREVTAVADHVTVLRQGRVVADRRVAGLTHEDLAGMMMGEQVRAAEPVEAGRPGDPVLSLESVTLRAAEREVLSGVDLTVRRAEIVGVAGVSGNGQRELSEVAAGIVEPDAGSRRLAGDAVGFIPEDRLATGLVGAMSIAENLAFRRFDRPPLSSRLWLRMKRFRELAQRLIGKYKIPADTPALETAKLSGGGLQRVIVAREMDDLPDLMVACQPTRGLDVVSARAVRSELVRARDAGAGVLFVSEDLDELIELSDRIVVVFGGRLVAEFPRGGADRSELGLHMAGATSAGGDGAQDGQRRDEEART